MTEEVRMPLLVSVKSRRMVAVLAAETRYAPLPPTALRCPDGSEPALPAACVPGRGHVRVAVELMSLEEFAEREGLSLRDVENVFAAPASQHSLVVTLADVAAVFARDAVAPA